MTRFGLHPGILGAALLCLSSGCGGDSIGESAWSGEVVQSPHGLVVRNPAFPLDTLRLELLWTRESGEWGELGGIRLGGDYVLASDRMATRVHLFRASDGSTVSSFGRPGEGPGELGRIYSVAHLGNRLYVSHSESMDLSSFTIEGEYLGEVEWGWPVGSLNPWSDSALVGFRMGGGGGPVAKDLTDSGEATAVGEGFQSPYPPEDYGTCTRATAKNGWVVRVLCSSLRVEVERPGSSTRLWIEGPDHPGEATEAEMDRYIERFWAMQPGNRPLTPIIQRQLDNLREGVRIRPVYSAVRVDPERGRILVVEQPFGDQSWEPAILHVFLGNGVYWGTTETGMHIKDLDLWGDTVVVLARNPDTDEVVMQAFSMTGDPDVERRAMEAYRD